MPFAVVGPCSVNVGSTEEPASEARDSSRNGVSELIPHALSSGDHAGLKPGGPLRSEVRAPIWAACKRLIKFRASIVITFAAVWVCLFAPGAALAGQMSGMQGMPGMGGAPATRGQISTMEVAPGLVVRYEIGEFDVETQTWSFRKGVVATYGLTTLHADSLIVHMAPGQERAEAAGNVQLDDPAGFVAADSLNFSWKQGGRAAAARRVMIRIGNVMLKAGRAELGPDRWDLYDVDASNCKESPPLFAVHTPHITIHPGSNGVIRRPTLKVLGYNVLTAPDQSFNLDARTQGLQYPNFTYHAGQGIGVSFKAGVLVTPTTNVAVSYGAVNDALPGYAGVVTNSLLPNAKSTSILTPSSEFSERFRYGYLDSIRVLSPSQEERYLETPRESISLGSSWNSFVTDRPDTYAYTKPVEGIYEVGGPAGSLSYLGQARLQTIQQYREAFHERMVLIGSLGLKPRRVLPKLFTIARLDSEAFVGNDFGWIRGSAGLVFRPISQLTLSGGPFASASAGQPLYPIDDLYAREGFTARVDLNLGATKMSYMAKWDTHLGLFDHEYSVSQVAGCLEPFIVARQFPRSYNLGIQLRLDEFYDVLRHRQFVRPGAPPQAGAGAVEPMPQMVISEWEPPR